MHTVNKASIMGVLSYHRDLAVLEVSSMQLQLQPCPILTCQRQSGRGLRRGAKFQSHKAIPHHRPAFMSAQRKNASSAPRAGCQIYVASGQGGVHVYVSPFHPSGSTLLRTLSRFYAAVRQGIFMIWRIEKQQLWMQVCGQKSSGGKFGLKLCWDMQALERK